MESLYGKTRIDRYKTFNAVEKSFAQSKIVYEINFFSDAEKQKQRLEINYHRTVD